MTRAPSVGFCPSVLAQRLFPRLLDHLPSVPFDQVAVGEDHAFEIPLQDTPQRRAGGVLIPPAELIFGRRLRPVPHVEHQLPPQSELPVGARRRVGEILDEVDQDQSPGLTVKERDFPYPRIAANEDLVELAGPRLGRDVAEQVVELDVRALALNSRAEERFGARKGRLGGRDVQIVVGSWRDDVGDFAEIGQGLLRRLVDLAGRVQQQPAVGQPDDGHARVELRAHVADGIAAQPDLSGDVFFERRRHFATRRRHELRTRRALATRRRWRFAARRITWRASAVGGVRCGSEASCPASSG